MQKLLAYIRKNIVFVSLLSALGCIIVFFGAYLIANQSEVPQNPNVTPTPPVVDETPTSITNFEGNYTKDAQVNLKWSIHVGNDKVTSVKLYQSDRPLGGDMINLTSYSFAQSLYQFPTGDVPFTLKVKLESGEELSEEITVFISYVLDIKMTTENVEDGVLLKLSYQYDKGNPVSVPKIKMFNNQTSQIFEFTYQDTLRETTGNLESATTTYKLGTSKVAAGKYDLTIRWIFDGLNTSKDFPIHVTK